jgi:uncharacterized protein involved in exopolysaccharide biosynthesis
VLQTRDINQHYGVGQAYARGQIDFGDAPGSKLDLDYYVRALRRRALYLILPFTAIVILGFYFVAMQRPSYLSEGKVLVEPREMAAGIVTSSAGERIQAIQQRVMTRDILLSIARKARLPANDQFETSTLDAMQQGVQIKLVEVKGTTIAFTAGFEDKDPEVAMRVASEVLDLILNEDARTRSNRATEATRILEDEVKGLKEKLDSAQLQIVEAKQRSRAEIAGVPDQEKSQLGALALLKAELIQKMSVYSDGHPVVVALKKRVAAMEKSIKELPPARGAVQSTQMDDVEALQRQTQALEKRLDDANVQLATARQAERLEKDQHADRFQVIEFPTVPQKPLKSGRLKMAGLVLALAAVVALGSAFAAETFDKSIKDVQELVGVVDGNLIISIPYISTKAELLRNRRRLGLIAVLVLGALSGTAVALIYWAPGNLFSLLYLPIPVIH